MPETTPAPDSPWWRDALVYQVYPRSLQDSDGDGEGDLRGILARLDHVADLGADALWLSPIYPSPMADGGYDVADYTGVDPRFGALEDLDALIAGAHERGLRVLLDIVPCHTSIEHPWFREHPDWYVWADGDEPPNNWVAAFGGRAWSRHAPSGRWYLHSFYPEQPDLDWRNPEVRAAMAEVLRFWRARGVDGFRLDAIDRLMKDAELRDDPPASAPPPLPVHDDDAVNEPRHSRNAPDIGTALAALREGAGADAWLVGEVYLPSGRLGPYLEHLDVCFGFELYHAPWALEQLRAAIAAAPPQQIAWVLSNHDFPRLPDRVGAANARAAALLLLTLPGPAFVFQGDELGVANGPGREPPHDRAGRDPYRHPFAWDGSRGGGFSDGEPWLPVVTPPEGPADAQASDPDSTLALYRDLARARRTLRGALEFADLGPGVLAYRRGEHLVAANLGATSAEVDVAGTVVRATAHAVAAPGDAPPRVLRPGEGYVALTGLEGG